MTTQGQIAIETTGLTDFIIPAPRVAEPESAPRTALDSPVEPRPATTTDVTDVQSSAPAERPQILTWAWALLGTAFLITGCAAAATFAVVAGAVLPLVAIVCLLFGLVVIGQAVGRRPASDETFDIR